MEASLFVNLRELKKGAVKEVNFKGTLNVDELELTTNAEYELQGSFYDPGNGIVFKGRINFSTPMQCSRCLEMYECKFTLPMTERFLPEPIADSDPDAFSYSGYKLNLDEMIRQAFLAGLPYFPCCSETCKGLCNTCGANLNLGTCSCQG